MPARCSPATLSVEQCAKPMRLRPAATSPPSQSQSQSWLCVSPLAFWVGTATCGVYTTVSGGWRIMKKLQVVLWLCSSELCSCQASPRVKLRTTQPQNYMEFFHDRRFREPTTTSSCYTTRSWPSRYPPLFMNHGDRVCGIIITARGAMRCGLLWRWLVPAWTLFEGAPQSKLLTIIFNVRTRALFLLRREFGAYLTCRLPYVMQ